ncbi:DUF3040 domain-containing protein [Arthrobacter psychrolactophilus]|nr:DUF3040 domain-containing protein [Arthrobacter psychrolactophilus]
MLFSEYERRVLSEVEEDFRKDAPRLAEMLRTGAVKRPPLDLVILACTLMPAIVVFVLALITQSMVLMLVSVALLILSVPSTQAMTRIIHDSSWDR